MKLLKLKNGSEEPDVLVTSTMMSLRGLLGNNPIAFYELTMKCRDDSHEFFGNTEKDLQGLRLVQTDGKIHKSIRNIVQSAVTGDGLDLSLESPFKA